MPRPAAAPNTSSRPLAAAEFGRLLAPLAADAGSLAVACSGGADSLCLTLLSHDWAARRGIALTALIVDHGLRPESRSEARQVAAWLRDAGIAAEILAWTGTKPTANRQAAARDARYALLEAWCRRHGVAHLLLAQHRDDQAETLLLRAARGSGVDGLSAMAPSLEVNGIRRLRPLLGIPKARLLATLRARGQSWIEDPSNRHPAYARTAMRAALAGLGDDAAAHLAQTAANMARARAALEQITAERLAQAVAYDDGAGIAWVDGAMLCHGPDEIALRALSTVLKRIGGEALPPRLERLERLLAKLRGGDFSHTLHRCRLLPWDNRLLILREARHLAPPLALKVGQEQVWDGRWRVLALHKLPRGLRLGAFGEGALERNGAFPGLMERRLPAPALPVLPALLLGRRVIGLPSLGLGANPGVMLAWGHAG